MPPWRRCSRVPDVLVSLAEGPPGRPDLARRGAITLQAGSHTGGPGTRSGPLLATAAGQGHVTDFADPLPSYRGPALPPVTSRSSACPVRPASRPLLGKAQ